MKSGTDLPYIWLIRIFLVFFKDSSPLLETFSSSLTLDTKVPDIYVKLAFSESLELTASATSTIYLSLPASYKMLLNFWSGYI